jgi:hypothetical protein
VAPYTKAKVGESYGVPILFIDWKMFGVYRMEIPGIYFQDQNKAMTIIGK